MGKNSKIEWCDHTFSPWWGCTKLLSSPACDRCYAAAMAKRYGHRVWGTKSNRRMMSDNHWKQPLKWNRKAGEAGKRAKVFCGSMCDWAEARSDLIEPRQRLFDLIKRTDHLDWLMLTKRPENIPELTPQHWQERWPDNAWAMTTAENQEQLENRAPDLFDVPARILGLSLEPLLGPIDLAPYLGFECTHEGSYVEPDTNAVICGQCDDQAHLDWVIVGCESGPKRRETKWDWVRSIRDQCVAAGVPFFLKQLDVDGTLVKMPELDGKIWAELPCA